MTREQIVRVKAKDGAAVCFSTTGRVLKLAAGEVSDKWDDGSPITLAEFESILAQEGVFEMTVEQAAPEQQVRQEE